MSVSISSDLRLAPINVHTRGVKYCQSEKGQSMGRQMCSQLHQQGEFLHNYYMKASVGASDHDSVVRIFVHLS